MSDFVTIVEVGPRDGLQNETRTLPVALRASLIDRLASCGAPVIEAGSFVSEKWVPQMAQTKEVLAAITPLPGTRYPVLVPNMKGLELALEAGAGEIAVFAAASETFSQKNTNCSIDESFTRLKPVIEKAVDRSIRVRGYISCVLDCPYEGEIEIATVARLSEQLLAAGCDEISLGETIGTGTPARAAALVETIKAVIPVERLAVHFHDTYGQALANILACLEAGIRIVDSSVSGLGGCPYASGASGNVASEDVVYMLQGLGIDTGIDIEALARTGEWISNELKRPNNSKAGMALLNRISASQL